MLDRIAPASTGDISTYARQIRATEQAASFRPAHVAGVPATPPAEVLHALDGAARVDEELRARGLSVSFDAQPEGGLRVRVIDSGGSVVSDMAPAEALDALSGDTPLDDLTA